MLINKTIIFPTYYKRLMILLFLNCEEKILTFCMAVIFLELGFLNQMFTLQVPIIIHNESEQATTWTQVYSEKTTKQSIPVITSWQLNERMYVAINLCHCSFSLYMFNKF